MVTRSSRFAIIGILVLAVVAVSGLIYINFRFSSTGTGGGAFYKYWSGTRVLLIEGESPYDEASFPTSDDVNFDDGILKNAEEGLSSVPLYALVITIPFSMIDDFVWARALWMTAQEIALFLLIFVMLKLTNWRPNLYVFTLLVLCLIFGYLSVVNLISGDMVIWTIIFFALALVTMQTQRDELSGGMLALTTFQPQIFFVGYIFILLWAFSQKKRFFILWFFGLILFMTVIGIILIPDWPIQYFRELFNITDQAKYIAHREILSDNWPGLGMEIAWLITIVCTLILFVEWWIARTKTYRWFVWTLCLTLVLSRLIGLPVYFAHNVILYIPIILTLSILHQRWRNMGAWINSILLIIFLTGGWLFVSGSVIRFLGVSLEKSPFILPFFVLIGLYWVRWWAIREQRLFLQ